jgi:hypothetical protein
MPGIPSAGGSPLKGLLRKSRAPKPEAPNPKPNDDVKPAPREDGSDTASLGGRTLVAPQRVHQRDVVRPYFGKGDGRMSHSEFKAAEKQSKKDDPELFDRGTVQVRNEHGDVTHEYTRKGFRETADGKIVKDDSYSGTASRHGVANTLTGGMYAGVGSVYRKLKPRPQEMADGGAAAKSRNLKIGLGLGAVALAGGGGYYFYTQSTGKDPFNPSANKQNPQNPASLPPGTVAPSQMTGYSGPPVQSQIGAGPVQIPPTVHGTGGYTQVNY